MIYSLTGKITRVDDNVIVVDANGVGYEVVCSLNAIDELTHGDGVKTVFTYLQVREDGVALYGFASLSEKKMFLNLISVSGIGPKMAIGVLSGMSAKMLASAVVNKDVSMLTKVKGLGKKTAERIVLELKEKVDMNVKASASDPMDGFEDNLGLVNFTREMSDAVSVLIELGIKKEEATRLVKSKAQPNDKTEEIIRKCL